MTPRLQEFAQAKPPDVQLDGELVTWDATGRPDFHVLSRRMLHKVAGIAVTYFVFDVLAVEGLSTTMLPYQECRELLEELRLEGSAPALLAGWSGSGANRHSDRQMHLRRKGASALHLADHHHRDHRARDTRIFRSRADGSLERPGRRRLAPQGSMCGPRNLLHRSDPLDSPACAASSPW